MIKKFICLTAIAAALIPLAGHAQMLDKGFIKAFLIKGDVTLVDNSTGESKPLKKGDTFKDGTTVTTGVGSTAVLLLSNGSSVVIAESSELDIENFQQEAFDPKQGSYLTLTKDPSISRTELALDSGTIAGETKKLTNESEYKIKTPLGSAGIRGTKWGVSVSSEMVDGVLVYTMIVANEEGTVVFETPISTGDVPDGEAVAITGTVNDDGSVTIDSVDPTSIPANIPLDGIPGRTFQGETQTIGGDTEDADLIVSPAGNDQ